MSLQMTIFAPSFANPTANAAPIPRAAPVMIATLSFSLIQPSFLLDRIPFTTSDAILYFHETYESPGMPAPF
jgi:hypothetical protein